MNSADGITIRALFDFLSAGFLLAGLFFMFVGAMGVVRLPDVYNRIHAASICVTLGLSAMLVAACFHLNAAPILTKSAITIVFIFVATPIGSHMLAKAAHDTNLQQWESTLSDDLAEDKQRYGWADQDAGAEPDAGDASEGQFAA